MSQPSTNTTTQTLIGEECNNNNTTPALFQPITIKGLTLKNRIVVSPMCQYSSENGFANDWHFQHVISRIVGGVGLFMMEATGVSDIGRISPYCLGLYLDEHVEMLKRITKYSHELGGKVGIQIGHAGRKGSLDALWDRGRVSVPNEEGGWDVIAPSPIAFTDSYKLPREMTLEDIEMVKNQFVSAAKRAVDAGFDVIELHGAHGYLIHSFLSPLSNFRKDQYGGSFENRIRFLIEIVHGVRKVIPKDMPLFVRLSATDHAGLDENGIEQGWTQHDTIQLSKLLKYGKFEEHQTSENIGEHDEQVSENIEQLVDLIDCSTGGTLYVSGVHSIATLPGYQVQYANGVKNQGNISSAAVGRLEDAQLANSVIEEKKADLIFIGRQMMNDPYWAIRAAQILGYKEMKIPRQYLYSGLSVK